MSTIVICSDHGNPGPLDIAGARVIMASDLCWRPRQLEGLVPAAETSLLVALHGSESQAGRVQAAVRRMGFDPLGVGVLDLERLDDADSITAALSALMARMDAYPGSRPEQVKIARRQARGTRRSLLSLGTPTYTGAPMVEHAHCAAREGCRACIDPCPADALTWADGRVSYDKTACIACGVCITTCPTGAVLNPVATPEAIEAEIRAAVAAHAEPVGIRYVCRAGRSPFEAGWHQVEVPCTGMLNVGWLLAPLVLGAGATTLTTCEERGCESGLSHRAEATLGDAAAVLAAIGVGPERMHGGAPPPRQLEFSPLVSGLLAAGSTHRVIAALLDIASVDPGFVALDHADIGTVTIDPSTCTACEMCASVCPTGALRSGNTNDGVHIDFDPRDCVSCAQCITVCPELDRGAIRHRTGFDPHDWRLGQREVRHEATARCETCGQPVAPAAMLDRITTILGDGHSGTIAAIGRRCIKCRGR